MKASVNLPQRSLFDVEVIANFLSAFPALEGGNPKVVAYIKDYYKEEKFRRLKIVESFILDERKRRSLTFQDIIDYLNFILVQNNFIFENFSMLKADGYFKGEIDSQILITAIFSHNLIDYLRHFNHDLLIRLMSKSYAEIDKSSEREVHKILVLMNAVFSHLETILKRYDHEGKEAIIQPVWRFSLYQNQLDSLISHAQLWRNQLGRDLKALGASSLVSKLEELQRIINNPQSHILLQILKAKTAYNIDHQFSTGIALIEEAEILRKQYANQGLLKPEEDVGLQFNILGIQLRYKVTRCKREATNKSTDLQAALSVAFELDDHFEAISPNDQMKESIQVSLFELFTRLLIVAQTKLNFSKLHNFDELKKLVEQLERVMLLYKKTITPHSQTTMSVNIEMVTRCYEGFSAMIQSQQDFLSQQNKKREAETLQLTSEKEKYDAIFSTIIESFPTKKRKPSPVKAAPVVIEKPDAQAFAVDASEESTDSLEEMPELIVVEDLEARISVAERCRQYFSHHRLNQYYLILDEFEDADKAEVMLYIGNHHMVKGYYDQALKWYENSIIQAEATPNINTELKKSIKHALSDCEKRIADELASREFDLQRMKENREMFIYHLGVEVCQEKGLNVSEMTKRDINQFGYEKFKALGRKNQRNDVQSNQAQYRQLLNEKISILKTALSLSRELGLRINVWKLSVSSHPASLYYNEREFPALKSLAMIGNPQHTKK